MSGQLTHSRPRARKGGAPPGNSNALKHGLYSRHISVRDDQQMEDLVQDRNTLELVVARTQLSACLDRQEEAASLADWLALDAAIQGWVQRICNILHHNAILGKDSRTAFVTIMDYIRVANDKQEVVP